MHAGDEILIVRLNGILEPFSAALKCGAQRRVCNPAFQGGGLTIRVRRYYTCLNAKISDTGQYEQCENYATEETYDRFIALDSRSQQVIGWGRPKKMTDNKIPASPTFYLWISIDLITEPAANLRPFCRVLAAKPSFCLELTPKYASRIA